jgi:predicted amidohydrolase YtcJ
LNMSRTLHIHNGNILLQASPPCYSRSLTIVDGVVTALDCEAPPQASLIDLQGKFAMPGLVDSHLHLVQGSTGMGDVDLRHVQSKEGFAKALLEAQTEVPHGRWLVASGWEQEQLGASPDVSWFPAELHVPCLCYRVDFHTAVLNATALSLLRVEEIAKVTGGSEITQGIVGEDALYNIVCPCLPESSAIEKQSRTRTMLLSMQTKGITLLGSMENLSDVEQTLCNIPLNELMRISVMCLDSPTIENLNESKRVATPFLHTSGYKAFLDGTLGSRTAKMYEPWRDVEGRGLWAGLGGKVELQSWVKTVVDAGFAPVIHAIGDEAVGSALAVLKGVPPEICARIEHAQFIAERDIPLIADRMFGVQPLHQPSDVKVAREAVCEKRAEQLHNWRRMLDAGGALSFGSDWPVADADPLLAMQVAIRAGLTVEEALHASTAMGAESLRVPLAGTLHCGSFGDLVVLDCNPFECDWSHETPKVVRTMLSGNTVYEKEIT